MTRNDSSSAPYLLPATDTAIARLAAPAAGERTWWSASIRGLGIRMLAKSEARVWRFQYRDAGGTVRKVTLGRHPALKLRAAERAAQQHAASVAIGGDPAAERRAAKEEAAAKVALADRIEEYLEHRRKDMRPRSWAEIDRALSKHAKPLHALTVADVTVRRVVEILDDLAKASGPVAANRTHAAICTFASWLTGRGEAGGTMVAELLAIPRRAEKPRDRVPSLAEVAAIWSAASGDGSYDRIVRMLILTGCRANEVGGLRWGEVGPDAITIPGSRMKNAVPHVIPLTDQMRDLIPPRPPGAGDDDAVFGANPDAPFSAWSRSKDRLDTKMAKAGVAIDAWTLHDLRRGFSTALNESGEVEPHVIEALLAHRMGGVQAVYNHAKHLPRKREALELWAAMVARAVAGGQSDGD